jgi:hypothetical protein
LELITKCYRIKNRIIHKENIEYVRTQQQKQQEKQQRNRADRRHFPASLLTYHHTSLLQSDECYYHILHEETARKRNKRNKQKGRVPVNENEGEEDNNQEEEEEENEELDDDFTDQHTELQSEYDEEEIHDDEGSLSSFESNDDEDDEFDSSDEEEGEEADLDDYQKNSSAYRSYLTSRQERKRNELQSSRSSSSCSSSSSSSLNHPHYSLKRMKIEIKLLKVILKILFNLLQSTISLEFFNSNNRLQLIDYLNNITIGRKNPFSLPAVARKGRKAGKLTRREETETKEEALINYSMKFLDFIHSSNCPSTILLYYEMIQEGCKPSTLRVQEAVNPSSFSPSSSNAPMFPPSSAPSSLLLDSPFLFNNDRKFE